MDSCRDDILFEVDMVYKVGAPGMIIVFGPNAEAIITGQNEEDVILATSILGGGRICVFSHGGYGKQLCDPKGSYENSTLYRNLRNWVTNKELPVNIKVLKLDESKPYKSLKELQEYDLLLSLGAKETTPIPLVEKYIEAGGAFIHAITPWGWLQFNVDKELYEVPYSKILLTAGISYAKGISKDHGPGFAPELSKAEDANLGRCILDHAQDVNYQVGKVNLISKLIELPPYLIGDMKKAVDKSWKVVAGKIVKAFPSGKIKTRNIEERRLLDFWLLGSDLQEKKYFKAHGVKIFPGDFDQPPVVSNKTVRFSSVMQDYYFTTCYAPAGAPVNLEVKNVTNVWKVIVGAHVDYLEAEQVNRWPKVSYSTDIKNTGTYNISSPFGGSIYFLSPKQAGSTIEATFSNVVACPRFDLLDKSISWKQSRNDPGLWADISGRYMTVTVPSSSIRQLEDPTAVMQLYDELLKAYNDLRGTHIDNERKMWIVADEQPCAGYMHAGYPIVTHLDVVDPKKEAFLLDAQGFKTKGLWGVFHEIGHNMQQSDWTFQGTGEVTVNIFTLYGMLTICGINSWTHPWLKNQTKGALNYLRSGADFKIWKREAAMALYFYAQLIHWFKFDVYKRVFRRYQNMKSENRPKQDQDKIDLWFLIFSEECKHNLAPIALFWGIPISDGALKKLAALNYEEFLPNDEITKEVPERVKVVKAKFPKLVQSF